MRLHGQKHPSEPKSLLELLNGFVSHMHQTSKKVIVGLQLTAATLKKALLLKYNQLSVLPSNKNNVKDLKLAVISGSLLMCNMLLRMCKQNRFKAIKS